MRQLNFDPHLIGWWSEVKEDFWTDIKPELLKLVKILLERCFEVYRDETVLVEWNQKAPQDRADYRNGFYHRRWDTELGPVENLRIPRTRNQAITGPMLERFKGNQTKIHEGLKDLFLAGVSTRRVGEVVQPFLGRGYSASFVSELTKTLDPHVRAFHERPLEDRYLYLFFDGIVLKGKDALGAKKRVILVAYGIRTDGHKELIDFLIHRSESEDAWNALLENLYRRGLHGGATQLIITDGSKGLHATLETVYPRIPRQRCWVHKLRNVANKLRRAIQAACLAEAKGIYLAASKRQAVKRFHRWAARWRHKAPNAVACLEADLEQLLSFFDCPREHHSKIRTTNAIERIFREVRRRTRPISCFTNDASIDRILYGLFHYFNDRWQSKPAFRLQPAPKQMELAA
ncbi:MAG: IS256 family transposase [Candidatus Omnitrophica bacterium]|nr:IS256 family transposase [Candidatus Omnitrophota bacterium]